LDLRKDRRIETDVNYSSAMRMRSRSLSSHANRSVVRWWLTALTLITAIAWPAARALAGDLGLGLPAQREIASRSTQDIALSKDGMLRGRLLDAAGQPISNWALVVVNGEHRRFDARTDINGRFAVGPMRGGVCAIITGSHVAQVRVWADRTAPPAAVAQIDLIPFDVGEGHEFRGQSPIGEFFCSDRFLFAAVLAGAVIIPVAIQSNRHDDTPSGS
jgi:hypothetical protein